MRARAILLVLAALAATARAGSPDAPEIVDDPDDTRGPALHGDILAGWLEGADEEGVTTVIRVAQLDATATARLTDHYFLFRVGGIVYCTFAYLDEAGEPMFMACHWDEATRFQREPAQPTTGAIVPGAPAELRVRFPWTLLDERAPGDLVLTDLGAETFDFKRPLPGLEAEARANPYLVDQARSDATFTFARAQAPPVPTPPTPAPVNATPASDDGARVSPAAEAAPDAPPSARTPAVAPALAALVAALVAPALRRR